MIVMMTPGNLYDDHAVDNDHAIDDKNAIDDENDAHTHDEYADD